jgi:hypothetical protein
MEPWIDGLEPVEHDPPGGGKVTLRLEGDPLEIFRMGQHFSTCLSPGDVNFFSVLANAADINKRVLYARDANGKVIGRCLLALARDGGILTFRPYCHDMSIGFSELVAGFTRLLASRMRTLTAWSGILDTLVAKEWYNDGFWELEKQLPFLEFGSPFRRSIATIDPSSFYERVQTALAPRGLDPLTLPIILLSFGELHDRPELVMPLLRTVPPERPLDASARLRAACLLRRAGAVTQAVRVLKDLARRHADVRELAAFEELPDLAQELTEAGLPSLSLRILKETWPKFGTYSEYAELWLLRMAEAHDRLFRRKLALDYYRRALTVQVTGESSRYGRRIAELEALLEGESGT